MTINCPVWQHEKGKVRDGGAFLVVAGLLAVIILAILIRTSIKHDIESFDARYPPISDDEFVARCGPGTDRDVALKVRRIVSDQLSLPYDQIHPSASFVDDLYAD